MIEVFALAMILPVFFSLVLTHYVIKLAFITGAVDKPDERKIHKSPTPRLGGVAAFLSFTLSFILLYFVFPGADLKSLTETYNLQIVSLALLVILIVGICDDIWILKPGQKFLAQLAAASLLYYAGFRITSITNLFSTELLNLGIFSFPITLLWIVGITNAFNLIDGLDGLAAGIAIIAAITIAAISFLHNDIATTIVSLILAGSLAGFLRYNFNPAKIFLGDSGSLFIGFILSVLSIQSSTKGSTAFSIIIPLIALGLPILDTLLSMLRRILKLFLPGQSFNSSFLSKAHCMFLPDKRHIHHQLLARGFSQRKVVLILYLVSFSFGLCAIGITADSLNSSAIILGLGTLIAFAVKKLGYKEIAVFKNGILLNFYKSTLLKHSKLQVPLDVISVFSALFLADYLTSSLKYPNTLWGAHAAAILCIGIIQLFVFLLNGVYRHKTNLSGLGDFLHIFRATLISIILTAVAVNFISFISNQVNNTMFIVLDYYFLVTLVAGSRIAFHALNYLFHRETGKGRKAIIYGADERGLITLQALLQNEKSNIIPIGFLDDNPELERKFLGGYPIYGGHWRLDGLLQKGAADEIILSQKKMNLRVFERIKRIAEEHKVPVRISKIKLEPITSRGIKNRPDKIRMSKAQIFSQRSA